MAPYGLRAAAALSLVAAFGLTMPGRAAAAGAGELVTGAHRGLGYKLYVPGPRPVGARGRAPMVVMLHGCTQDPDQFMTSTRMNQLAEREGFVVLYPAQSALANPRLCWNWFMPAHTTRGKGEAGAIAGLVEAIASERGVDRTRIYIAGLSAGGAMAAVMAACYPEVFAAVGVAAGLPFAAATDVDGALKAMSRGAAPGSFGPEKVLKAMGAHKRVVPLVVVHGTADTRVVPANADQLAGQWAAAAGVTTGGGVVGPVEVDYAAPSEGRPGKKAVWRDAAGTVVVERWLITGLGHAWPGGDAAGTHVDPLGPSATDAMWAFFSRAVAPAASSAPRRGS